MDSHLIYEPKFYSIMKTTFILLLVISVSCTSNQNIMNVDVYETSASGNQLLRKTDPVSEGKEIGISIFPESKFQTIIGFGGAFTESSAYLLRKLGAKNQKDILQAYFGTDGANYTLTRTHINSCDFSLSNYSYASQPGDVELEDFSIDEDRDDLIPMIKAAQLVSKDGFKIISSPWTAPPWMKDNNEWRGGKLKPEYYATWALYFSKYIKAYKEEGIDIWGVTVENEPLGNGNNWESMHYTPQEMVDFVKNHLGPQMLADGHDVKILGYDQNRGKELEEWAEVLLGDEEALEYFYGIAVHWYTSTVDWFPESLNVTHQLAPDKHIIHTEGCIDAEVPHWKEDDWYWKKEATDWGYDWAPEADKPDHPKYVPVYRYARDIIGCMNNWVEGWVDWNMILDKEGGPNWAKNWCIAPVIVDPDKDEVYYTPLYYTLTHFSKFIRPGAVRIGFELSDNDQFMATATLNPDGSIALVVLNMNDEIRNLNISINGKKSKVQISPSALQTIILNNWIQ